MADLNDWNKPTVADSRVDVQDTHLAHAMRSMKMDPGTASNRPFGAKLAELISNVFTFKHWNGSAYDTWLTISNFWRGVLDEVNAADARAALGVLGASETMPLLRNFHQGFTLSTVGSSTTITIGSGQAADSTNSVVINLAAAINKTTAAWAAGSGNGGLDTGSIAANQRYYFYAISNPTSGAVDVVFSAQNNFLLVTKPSGFTQGRIVGYWRTNSLSQWENWYQIGDDVFPKVRNTFVAGSAVGSSSRSTISIPEIPPSGTTPVTISVNFESNTTGTLDRYLQITSILEIDFPTTNQICDLAFQQDTASQSAAGQFSIMAAGGVVGFRSSGANTIVYAALCSFSLSFMKNREGI